MVVVMPINFTIPGPFQNRTTCELCAVITDDARRLAADTEKRVQFVGYTRAGYRIGVRDPRAGLRPLRRLTPTFSWV